MGAPGTPTRHRRRGCRRLAAIGLALGLAALALSATRVTLQRGGGRPDVPRSLGHPMRDVDGGSSEVAAEPPHFFGAVPGQASPPRGPPRRRAKEQVAELPVPVPALQHADGTTGTATPAALPAATPTLSEPQAASTSDAAAGAAAKAKLVRQAMRHAWGGYQRYAMGAAELRPVSKTAKDNVLGGAGIGGLGVTVVDAMSTLHVMGLQEEFSRALSWVAANLTFEGHRAGVSFFETTIRLLGGLVACHDLSSEQVCLEKARDLGDRLLHNFNPNGPGLPAGIVQLDGGGALSFHGITSLAAAGSNLLEFTALSRATGDPKYMSVAKRAICRLHRANPDQALLSKNLDLSTGRPLGQSFSVGAEADSYFEYLLKEWLFTGKQDDHWRRRWETAADEILARLVRTTPHAEFTADLQGRSLGSELEHLACFWPGNLALGVMQGAVKGAKVAQYMSHAESLARSCFMLYNSTATGLGAERVRFDLNTGAATVTHAMYWQRPEVVESLFYLYRATKNETYRDWGWAMFTSFQEHCKQEAGYAGVTNVNQVPPRLDDVQQSWLLAETLKYWYLLFAPDSALSLDHWVFNTEAHPLRVGAPLATSAGERASEARRLRAAARVLREVRLGGRPDAALAEALRSCDDAW